jgi:NADPH:quinone reductase-like Zn-dependent oxidoreductase
MLAIPDSLDHEAAAALIAMGLSAIEVLERIFHAGSGHAAPPADFR